jgi:hypothetical protein
MQRVTACNTLTNAATASTAKKKESLAVQPWPVAQELSILQVVNTSLTRQ